MSYLSLRYIDILTRLRGFQDKFLYLVLLSLYITLFWEFIDKRILIYVAWASGAQFYTRPLYFR